MLSCVLCERTGVTCLTQVPDPLASTRVFRLVACAGCGLVWTEPLLSKAELEPYYVEDSWQPGLEDGREAGLVSRFQRQFIQRRIAAGLRPLLRQLPPGARVLDVGCGSGTALTMLAQAGCVPYGVETSRIAAEMAARTGAPVACGTLEDAGYDGGFFDGVTLVHVLEHLPAPERTLTEVHRLLRPGGWLLVEVPNIESVGSRVFRERWYALNIPQHLYHFAPATLNALAARCGFQVRSVSHFSARSSPASLVVSLVPALAPPLLRRRERTGRRVLARKAGYLFLQLAATPVALAAAAVRRGEVIRLLARKPGGEPA